MKTKIPYFYAVYGIALEKYSETSGGIKCNESSNVCL